jgi:hypothetical protein
MARAGVPILEHRPAPPVPDVEPGYRQSPESWKAAQE